MERKVVAKKGPSSPSSEMSEEEDVFDYARFEDFSNESGPVPREAYAALRKGIFCLSTIMDVTFTVMKILLMFYIYIY